MIIAIIPDGDRRWAKKRKLGFDDGYKEMAKKIAKIIDWLMEQEIYELYVWCNSIKNFDRPQEQIRSFLTHFMEVPELISSNKVRVIVKGDFDYFKGPFKEFGKKFEKLEQETKKSKPFKLVYFVNYATDYEMVRVFNRLKGKKVTYKKLIQNLDTPKPIDLLIRFGKQQRLSGFIPLNSLYTEIRFVNKLFPDVKKSDITNILNEYKKTNRTLGK